MTDLEVALAKLIAARRIFATPPRQRGTPDHDNAIMAVDAVIKLLDNLKQET